MSRIVSHIPKASASPLLAPALVPTSTANAVFNGLNSAGLSFVDNAGFQTAPPDTTGSVGPNYYVEIVNSIIGVYNRSDLSLVSKLDFNTWLATGGTPFTLPLCDPQIQWDQSSQRWLYVVLACDFTHHKFLYGWSKTPDPSNLVNGWCRFSLSTPGVLTDFPKLGHSAKYMLIGTNNFSDPTTFVTAQITWMRTPDAGVTSCTTPSVNSAGTATNPLVNGDHSTPTFTPVPVNTSTNAGSDYVISAYDLFSNGPIATPQNRLAVFHVDSVGVLHADPDLTVSTYNFPPVAPNFMGNSAGLDTSDARLTQAVGDPTTGIYTQHTVMGGGSGFATRSKVSWYEIQVVSSVPRLVQEGDIANSTDWVFNAAISPRADGQGAVIFYNRQSMTSLVVIAAQGRMLSTPTGQMDPGEILLASSSTGDSDFTCNFTGHNEPCRWGDYSGASPDPLNPNVVWGSNQALTTQPPFGNPSWGTQNFAIAGPVLSRVGALQSSPVPTPTRNPALPGSTPSPGTR